MYNFIKIKLIQNQVVILSRKYMLIGGGTISFYNNIMDLYSGYFLILFNPDLIGWLLLFYQSKLNSLEIIQKLQSDTRNLIK